MTVNELLVLINVVKGRINDLLSLRNSISVRETWLGTQQKIVEPQYDVKAVDKKIVELKNFLLVADTKIKQANAVTQINIEVDAQKLLSPIE